MNNLKQTDVQPVYLFPTGGRGLELANHISLIQYITLLQKLLDMDYLNPENPTVLRRALTGVAGINTNGITITYQLHQQFLKNQVRIFTPRKNTNQNSTIRFETINH